MDFPLTLLVIAVLLAFIPTSVVAWRRCVVTNFKTLSTEEHVVRIGVWYSRARRLMWSTLAPFVPLCAMFLFSYSGAVRKICVATTGAFLTLALLSFFPAGLHKRYLS